MTEHERLLQEALGGRNGAPAERTRTGLEDDHDRGYRSHRYYSPDSGDGPDAVSHKNDRKDGKVRWELLPLTTLEEVVKVYTYGAAKYGCNTWQGLEDGYERYKAALFRHIVEYERGNVLDDESGLPHLAHAAWNAIAMLHIAANKPAANAAGTVAEKPAANAAGTVAEGPLKNEREVH